MDTLSGEAYLAIQWLMVAVCTAAVTTRLAVRAWRGVWTFWVSDILLVLAVLLFATIAVGNIFIIGNQDSELADYSSAASAKWTFVAYLIFFVGFYLPRFSLLSFYYQLFPVAEPRLRMLLYFATAYTSLACLATLCLVMFWCGADVDQLWAPVAEQTCSLYDKGLTNLYINWSISFSTEVLLLVLPLPLLKRLKTLSKREKAGLTVIFMLGIATLITSCIRVSLESTNLSSYTTYTIENTEIAIQILVVTAPALRPLLGSIRRRARAYGKGLIILPGNKNSKSGTAVDLEGQYASIPLDSPIKSAGANSTIDRRTTFDSQAPTCRSTELLGNASETRSQV